MKRSCVRSARGTPHTPKGSGKVWQNSVFSRTLVILFRFCVVFCFFVTGAVSALHFPVQHQTHHDFHHEMSSGLTTALEFLMSAEIAKTFLLQNLESVVPLAATFALRAMMSLMLHSAVVRPLLISWWKSWWSWKKVACT